MDIDAECHLLRSRKRKRKGLMNGRERERMESDVDGKNRGVWKKKIETGMETGNAMVF